MTYKYNKSNDSPVMRSFEKLANEKGWVSKKEIKKEASVDFGISGSFDENFLNLISGLQKSGMNSFASELKSKFIEYKKAESNLYDLKNTDIKKLVDSAHPEKSPNITSDKESVIESLYDQHNKMTDLLKNKKINKSAQQTNSSYISSILYANLALLFNSDVTIPSFGGLWNTKIKSFVDSLVSKINTESRISNGSSLQALSNIAIAELNSALPSIQKQKQFLIKLYTGNQEEINKIESIYSFAENSFISTIKKLQEVNPGDIKNPAKNQTQPQTNQTQQLPSGNEYYRKDEYLQVYSEYVALYKEAFRQISGAKIEAKDDQKKQQAEKWISDVKSYLAALKGDLNKLSIKLNNYFDKDAIDLAKSDETYNNVGLVSFNGLVIKFNGLNQFKGNKIKVNHNIEVMFSEDT